jgi:hypothetical protein
MDLIAREKVIKLLNEETIPALVAAANQLVDKADTKLDENVATLIDEAQRLLDMLGRIPAGSPREALPMVEQQLAIDPTPGGRKRITRSEIERIAREIQNNPEMLRE